MPFIIFIKYKLLCAVLVIAFSVLNVSAQIIVSREYQLKAAFLYNFCQFVDWPPVSFTTPDQPFIIGILGENPFGAYLEETVAGERVHGHPVVIRYYSDADAITACHILFVGISDPKKSEEAIAALKGKSVLTIGDKPDFLTQSGMIKFYTVKNNIRFQINLEEARSEKLVLSSKLLRLADIYDPSKN